MAGFGAEPQYLNPQIFQKTQIKFSGISKNFKTFYAASWMPSQAGHDIVGIRGGY